MPLDVLAFYNGLSEHAKGYPYLQRYGRSIDQLALFQIPVQNDGTLRGRLSRGLINEAHTMGIKVLVTVSNLNQRGLFSTDLIGRLIRDQDFANFVWQNIRDLLAAYQFDGVNLDLEKAAPEDRPLYSRFIQRWSSMFKQENYLVTTDVPAKSSSDPHDVWKGAIDYQVIGQAVDEVIVMTYEEHWPGSPPGCVASIPWVTRMLNYALANIPRQKIYMGIPLYGYDWPERGRAHAVSYHQAMEVARRYGSPIQWDAWQHCSYFHYESGGVRHTVYFEDPRSLKDKLDLALSKGIRGVAIWEMNISYPQAWDMIQTYTSR